MTLNQKKVDQLNGARSLAEAIINKQNESGKGMKLSIGRYGEYFYWYMAPYAHAKDAVASGCDWYSLLEYIGILKVPKSKPKKS